MDRQANAGVADQDGRMNSTEAAQTGAPREVKTAFAMCLAVALVDVVTTVLGIFVGPDSGLEQMRAGMGQHGAAVQAARSIGALMVISALWLLIAFKMRSGRNWARLTLVGIGTLSVCFFLAGLSMDGYHWTAADLYDVLPGGTQGLLHIGAIGLMFLPASNAFFSATKRAG